jgi:hypothetical protein
MQCLFVGRFMQMVERLPRQVLIYGFIVLEGKIVSIEESTR